jgi:hypothetical protein
MVMIAPSLHRADVPPVPSVGILEAVFFGAAGFAAAAGAAGLPVAAGVADFMAVEGAGVDAALVPFMQPDMNALYVIAFLSASLLVFQVAAQLDIVPRDAGTAACGAGFIALADAGALGADAVLLPFMQPDMNAL